MIGALAALGALSTAPVASALEFGPISLDSHLNQPLAAQLKLSSLSASERSTLDVHIASSDLFERFGIKRTAEVDSLRVTTHAGRKPGQVRVEISTPRPVREPFVDFLLEASTSSGSGLREYTVLLNPTGAAPAASSARTTSSSSARDDATSSARQPVSTGSAASSAQSTTDRTPSGNKRYVRVGAGDTLSAIAAASRPPGVTTAQMTVALFEANPEAFAGGMDHLRRGVRLSLPEPDAVRAIDRDAAGQRLAAAAESGAQPDQPANTSHPSGSDAVAAQASGEAPPASLSQQPENTPTPTTTANTSPGRDRQAAGVAGNPAFGQLSMPRTDTWPRQQSKPAANDAAEPHADNDAKGNESPSATDTLEPDAAAEPESRNASPDTGQTESAADSAAASQADEPPPEDVTEGGDGAGWSPRPWLLGGLVLLLLVLGLLAYRRRSYKSVPMDFEGIDPDGDDSAEASPVEPAAEPNAQTSDGPATAAASPAPSAARHESPTASPGRVGEPRVVGSTDSPAAPSASHDADTFVPALLRNRPPADAPVDESDLATPGSGPAPVGPGGVQDIQDGADDDSPRQDMADASTDRDNAPINPAADDHDVAMTTGSSAGERQHDLGRDDEWAYEINQPTADQAGNAQPGADQAKAGTAPAPIDPRAYNLDDPAEQGAAQTADSDQDSVAMRLDLARMYLDMEAPDMARELLEDVIAQGTEHQTDEARSLLQQC